MDILVTGDEYNIGYWMLTKKGDIFKTFLHHKGTVSSGRHKIKNRSKHKIIALSGETNEFIYALDEVGNVYEKLQNTSSNVKFTKIENLSKIIKISVGVKHSVFLSENGEVYVRGCNIFGQLGLCGTIYELINELEEVTKIKNIKNIKDIACGPYFTMLVTCDGTVYFFGRNYEKKLLNGIVECREHVYIPFELPNIKNIVAVSCGTYHFTVLNSENIATVKISDRKVETVSDVVAICSFREFPFVIKKNGTIARCYISKKFNCFYFHKHIPSLLYLAISYINRKKKKFKEQISILPKDIKKFVEKDSINCLRKYTTPSFGRKLCMILNNKTVARSNSLNSMGEWFIAKTRKFRKLK